MSQSNPDQPLIEQLIQQHGGSDNADLVEDIIETALRLADDKADRLDVKVINSALKELRYASKIFAPFRGQRKVTVFGSARTKPESPEYQQAVAFGKAIVEHGFMVITGAGRDHGRCPTRRGPRQELRPEHPPALRAGAEH